jgi:hypothetical protein
MAILNRNKRTNKPCINLKGDEGNAFYIVGCVNHYAQEKGLKSEEKYAIVNEMTSGDYSNLLQVFNTNFGEQVDLIV